MCIVATVCIIDADTNLNIHGLYCLLLCRTIFNIYLIALLYQAAHSCGVCNGVGETPSQKKLQKWEGFWK